MEKDSKAFMKSWLENLEFLEQEKTQISPQKGYLGPVKAILWDIYGTLMISASGDIDKARFSREVILESLADCNITIQTDSPQTLADEIMTQFPLNIKQAQEQERANGNQYPEVDIVEIWKQTLSPFLAQKQLIFPDHLDFRTMAFRFELGFNRIGPMKGLKNSLIALSRKIPLGIISNAQFYTPIIMNYLLSDELIDYPSITFFQPDLCIYSYQYHRAKPGMFLYQKAKEALKKRNISPEETLYVGNDMLNDILPAHELGFKTILYAGDKRSLRLRKNREEIKNLNPHGIITEVSQINDFLKD